MSPPCRDSLLLLYNYLQWPAQVGGLGKPRGCVSVFKCSIVTATVLSGDAAAPFPFNPLVTGSGAEHFPAALCKWLVLLQGALTCPWLFHFKFMYCSWKDKISSSS